MGTIRGLRNDDWEGWSELWAGYLAFYRAELDDLTTQSTFERLCAGEEGMFGLLALDDAGQAIGMANCVVHATTWSRQPKCYLEDLFVDPAARGQDVGRALLLAVKEAGTSAGRTRPTGTPSSTTAGPGPSTTRSDSPHPSSSTKCDACARLQGPRPGMTISVLLADDQPLLRRGFRMVLEAEADLKVAAEARTAPRPFTWPGIPARRRPDGHPDARHDGIEATRQITAELPADTRVLVLTTFDLDEYAFGALRAGASGFLLKDAPPAH